MSLLLPGILLASHTGLGIMIGSPTGISFKQWKTTLNAIDAGVAWAAGDNVAFHIHVDYLRHNDRLVEGITKTGRLTTYTGLGFRLTTFHAAGRKDDNAHELRLGVRIPLGATYLFQDFPFDAFGEVVPIINLIPGTDLDMNAAIGIRFYFR